MLIRKYQASDKKQIIEMVSENLAKIFNGDPTKFEYLKEFNVKKNYLLYLVAETQGNPKKIIATMAVKKINKNSVRLKRMYVRGEYQGRGIAQKMLNQIIKFSKQQGYKKIILSTYSVMKNAKRFYKRNNFKEFDAKPVEQVHVVRGL